MKNYSYKLIIFPLIIIIFLCIPKLSSSAECCETIKCSKNASSYYNNHVKFPFRIREYQPESCGCQGFDLYCDDDLGLLLELPNAGNFTVKDINFYSRKIVLSDPNDCLVQKLLNFDFDSTTPFRQVPDMKLYMVFNCSGSNHKNFISYDKIDCLSGSDHTVLSVTPVSTINDDNCMLLKVLGVPHGYGVHFDTPLSSISSIKLTWEEQGCVSCSKTGNNKSVPVEPPSTPQEPNSKGSKVSSALTVALVIGVSLGLIILPCCIYTCKQSHHNTPTSESDMIANISTTRNNANMNTTSAPASSSLDQFSINTYPMIILGEHNGFTIKPDHDTCSICLAEYSLKDTLIILPHCLHRFHAECIGMWWKSQPICPICRTSPTQLTNGLL